MSHEIRTPLNSGGRMTGFVLDTPVRRAAARYTEIVRSSGESLLALINDILDFSKMRRFIWSWSQLISTFKASLRTASMP